MRTHRWREADSSPRSRSFRAAHKTSMRCLIEARACVPKGGALSLGWSGTRESRPCPLSSAQPVGRLVVRSQAPPSTLVLGNGRSRAPRTRLRFLLQPPAAVGDLRRRLKPHRRLSTLRASSSHRRSGVGRRRPKFRLFHRGRRRCVSRRRFARRRCRTALGGEPDIVRGSAGFGGAGSA